MSASNPLRLPVFGETLLQGTVLTIVMLLSLIAVSMLTCKFIELPGPGVGAPRARQIPSARKARCTSRVRRRSAGAALSINNAG